MKGKKMDTSTKILDSMGKSPFWRNDPSEGMGATHLLHKFPDMKASNWSKISPQEVEQEIYIRMGSGQVGLRGEELHKAMQSAKNALEEAIFKSTEKDVRKKSCANMIQMANKLEHAAKNTEAIGHMLAEIQQMQAGSERIAVMEALGIESDAARGLDLQMSKNTSSQIEKRLSENRLAMINRSPLSMGELAENIKGTASALRSLADRLKMHRDINVFDLCPQIAKGVLSRLEKDSIAYQTIDKRLKDHRMYKKADKIFGLAASLLFEIGAIAGGPLGEGAHLLWTGATAASGIISGADNLRLNRLSFICGAKTSQQFSADQESAYGEIFLGASKAHTLKVPFADTALEFSQTIR